MNFRKIFFIFYLCTFNILVISHCFIGDSDSINKNFEFHEAPCETRLCSQSTNQPTTNHFLFDRFHFLFYLYIYSCIILILNQSSFRSNKLLPASLSLSPALRIKCTEIVKSFEILSTKLYYMKKSAQDQ